jgi:hypothetical protein
MGCIAVITLSAFPVSISKIGFTLGADPRKSKRLAITASLTSDHQPIARTLQPRHSVPVISIWIAWWLRFKGHMCGRTAKKLPMESALRSRKCAGAAHE